MYFLYLDSNSLAIITMRITKNGPDTIPIDRFGRKRKGIAKVALGAEKSVPWEHREDIKELIKDFIKKGVQVVSVGQHDTSIPYTKLKVANPTVFILGEETKGIPEDILEMSDEIIEIPMKGKKESLNVSVATGIILFSTITK